MKHQSINSRVTHYSGITYYGNTFEAHFHNSYELICVLKGSIKVTVNSNDATLGEKEFILISPCMVHGISESANAVYFIAIITTDYIPDFFEANKRDIARIFSVDSETFGYIRSHLFEAKGQQVYQLKACLYMLLSFAERGKLFLTSADMNYDFIFAVNSYITEHFSAKITRAELAALTGYEEHYFSSVFKKNFRIGLKRYINTYRISHAARLLRATDAKIARIALDSGFSSVKEFNNVFLSLMSETPSQYRKNTT